MPRGLRMPITLPMLTLGTNTSDRVDLATPTPLESDPFSLAMWVYVTTLTNQRVLYDHRGSTGGLRLFRLMGTSGDVQWFTTRATTSTSFITNSLPVVLNTLTMLAVSFRSAGAAGEVTNIYRGTLTSPLAECTYGTATDGTGGVTACSGTITARIGNNQGATVAIQGSVGPVGLWNAELSANDFERWRRDSMARARFAARGLYRLGEEAAFTQDASGNGNVGTITGGVIAPSRGLYAMVDPYHRRGRQIAPRSVA